MAFKALRDGDSVDGVLTRVSAPEAHPRFVSMGVLDRSRQDRLVEKRHVNAPSMHGDCCTRVSRYHNDSAHCGEASANDPLSHIKPHPPFPLHRGHEHVRSRRSVPTRIYLSPMLSSHH